MAPRGRSKTFEAESPNVPLGPQCMGLGGVPRDRYFMQSVPRAWGIVDPPTPTQAGHLGLGSGAPWHPQPMRWKGSRRAGRARPRESSCWRPSCARSTGLSATGVRLPASTSRRRAVPCARQLHSPCRSPTPSLALLGARSAFFGQPTSSWLGASPVCTRRRSTTPPWTFSERTSAVSAYAPRALHTPPTPLSPRSFPQRRSRARCLPLDEGPPSPLPCLHASWMQLPPAKS